MEPEKPRRRGRKLQYAGKGAPILRVRLDPIVHDRVTQHPDGARRYIERLVGDDMEREQE